MAMLRRGSSHIDDENLNSRLQREGAKTGAITASLAWNDPSDLDLHAHVELEAGGKAHVCFRNKSVAGGVLDVDMHARDSEMVDEPVENIFWQSPPAGTYSIRAHLFKKRGHQDTVRFRAILKREGEEDDSVEGELKVGAKSIECFRYVVDADGNVQMKRRLAARLEPRAAGAPPRPPMVRAALAPRAKVKATIVKAKAKTTAKAAAKEKAGRAKRRAKAAIATAKAKAKAKAAMAKAREKARAAAAKTKAKSIARGKLAKVQVFKGTKIRTSTGLKKADLTTGKRGKIVTVNMHAAGKANKWAQATARARAIKGFQGFRPLKKGGSFYEKVKEIVAQS